MDSFEVENFRSLKHLKLEKLARVNLLVGKNNSGKTSVLEAIYALTRIELSEWFEELESQRGLDNEDHDFRTLFFKFNLNERIEVKATYQGDNDSVEQFSFTLGSLSEPSVRRRKGIKSLRLTIYPGKEVYHNIIMSKGGEYSVVEYDALSDEADDFLSNGLTGQLSERHVSNFLTTTIDLDGLSGQLSELTINKNEEKLIEVLRQIDPRVKSLSLDSKGKVYFDLGESFGTLSSINHIGEGVQRLLTVVAAIASSSGGIVLIDEIDNGLHYSALRILWKGILQAAHEYDVQIFATTHSAEALKHLTWVLDEEGGKQYRDDVAAYTLIRAKDDTVRSFRYNYEQLDFAMEHDMEVRN